MCSKSRAVLLLLVLGLALSPSTFAEKVEYIMGTQNTNTCPSGYERFSSASECEDAAAALGKRWAFSSEWTGSTKGCFTNYLSYVYFNSHTVGMANAVEQPICKMVKEKASKIKEETASSTASGSSESAAPEALTKTDYVIGAPSTNTCQSGYKELSSVSECKDAAAALGKKWAFSSDWELHPKGCFTYDYGTSAVYFNTHPVGVACDDEQPICKTVKEASGEKTTGGRRLNEDVLV